MKHVQVVAAAVKRLSVEGNEVSDDISGKVQR
jgi:hypothetical protein